MINTFIATGAQIVIASTEAGWAESFFVVGFDVDDINALLQEELPPETVAVELGISVSNAQLLMDYYK